MFCLCTSIHLNHSREELNSFEQEVDILNIEDKRKTLSRSCGIEYGVSF